MNEDTIRIALITLCVIAVASILGYVVMGVLGPNPSESLLTLGATAVGGIAGAVALGRERG